MPLDPSVKALKIHPAIGVARVSTNDDFYIEGEQIVSYKTNGLMRRQAVRFRLFAYGDQNEGIEELTPARLEALGLEVVWHARISNQKIAHIRGDQSFAIVAEGASNQQGGKLVGQLNGFAEGTAVPLGEIRADGVFVPPKARIFRETETTPIVNFGLHNRSISDNAGDGFITATLTERGTGTPVATPVFPACVLIAPSDFSPDQDDPEVYPGRQHLYDFFLQQIGGENVTPVNPVNAAARQLDREALERCTTDFNPGIEFSTDAFTTFAEIFYPETGIGDPNELRVLPKSDPLAPGVTPGEMTLGLCSPWQFDFRLCTCGFWAAQRPDTAFKDEAGTTQVRWLRKQVNDPTGAQGGLITTNEGVITHVDKLGVIRVRNERPVETERTQDIP